MRSIIINKQPLNPDEEIQNKQPGMNPLKVVLGSGRIKGWLVLGAFVIVILLIEMLIFNRGYTYSLLGLERHLSVSDGGLFQFSLENGVLTAQSNDPNIAFYNLDVPIGAVSLNCSNSMSGAMGQVYYRNRWQELSEARSVIYYPTSGQDNIQFTTILPIVHVRFDLTSITKDEVTCGDFVINPRIFGFNILRFINYIVLILLCALFCFDGKVILSFTNTILIILALIAISEFQKHFGLDKIAGGWQFLSGNQGAIEAYGQVISYGPGTGDRSDVSTCLEILNEVPGPAPVLNLNGFAAVEPCLFSPLLPPDKIVHHYESITITEPYYHTLMFGEPESAYSIYRKLGINNFYIRKNDLFYVNLGYSLALQPQHLGQYFDIYAETNDFYILTWRGEGLYPVTPEIERDFSTWYENSKDSSQVNIMWWKGKVAFDERYPAQK